MVVAAMVAFSLGACNPLNKMAKNAEGVTYTVTPDPLEMHGDTVALVIDGKIPPKFFNKKVIVHVRPFFESEGAVVKSFEPLTLVVKMRMLMELRSTMKKEGNFSMNLSIHMKPAWNVDS